MWERLVICGNAASVSMTQARMTSQLPPTATAASVAVSQRNAQKMRGISVSWLSVWLSPLRGSEARSPRTPDSRSSQARQRACVVITSET